jgi:monothiol glutaredoxin
LKAKKFNGREQYSAPHSSALSWSPETSARLFLQSANWLKACSCRVEKRSLNAKQPQATQITMSETLTPEIKSKIDAIVSQDKIVVFMKGNKLMPQCGFSNNVVQILNILGVPFQTFDVLSDYEVRQGIKEYSNWPTIPQVYVNGEFIGGSDILIEMYQNGQLQEMLQVALAS